MEEQSRENEIEQWTEQLNLSIAPPIEIIANSLSRFQTSSSFLLIYDIFFIFYIFTFTISFLHCNDIYLSTFKLYNLFFKSLIEITIFATVCNRGVNRAGPNAGRAGPNLGGPGRAERFYNLLWIRAGFLQSFTRTNFLTNLMFYMFAKQFENFLNFLQISLKFC